MGCATHSNVTKWVFLFIFIKDIAGYIYFWQTWSIHSNPASLKLNIIYEEYLMETIP